MDLIVFYLILAFTPFVGYFFMRARNPAPFVQFLTTIGHVVVATIFLAYAADPNDGTRSIMYGGYALLYLVFAYAHWRAGKKAASA